MNCFAFGFNHLDSVTRDETVAYDSQYFDVNCQKHSWVINTGPDSYCTFDQFYQNILPSLLFT